MFVEPNTGVVRSHEHLLGLLAVEQFDAPTLVAEIPIGGLLTADVKADLSIEVEPERDEFVL